LREARAVAAIQHANVVTISDAGLFEGTPYLVMELLEGEDLEQHLLHHGPFAASELIALALPLVAALAAAHDAGVIHRDLKPGNIFLARGSADEVAPKLLDFGISKFASSSEPPNLAVTAFDQLIGSPLYLPPEALQGSRELTARSDQYSLGVVLYECITGQAPFYRDDLVPLLNAICEGSCPAPRQLRPETPPALEQAILRAMSVDPRQRFAHIRELGQALLELADPHARHRWGPALAVPGERMVPPTSLVVASAEAPQRRPARAAAALERRRLWGTCALLATGCLLLALALGRSRSASKPGVAYLPAQPAAAQRDEAAAGPVSAVSPAAVIPVVVQEEPLRSWDLSLVPAAPGTALPAPRTLSSRPPGPVVAAVPSAVPSAVGAVQPVSASQKRRPAHSAPDEDSSRELSRLFFPGSAGVEAHAARRARPVPAAPAPVLVNEAPLFD
jgi:serine/threonine-protein kinase